jgi:XRE family aerobic/anaerobic benzoate catabolism transcriptional regulator
MQGWNVANNQAPSEAAASSGFIGQVLPADDAFPYSESEFLTLLGDRVRGARVLSGMSRKELARKSCISERYIAQIETGKGNVSIMLLLRIARAMSSGKASSASSDGQVSADFTSAHQADLSAPRPTSTSAAASST